MATEAFRLAHPLLRPVPTLMALARSRRRRSAFTLIELLVAVALASVIIITAVSCFQMVAKVVATANALSTENGLLRSGFLLAMQDVDYWHSHADDKLPYNKQFMRMPTQLDSAATGTPENIWRRPFQPVRFAPRTDTRERDPFPATGPLVAGGLPQRDSGYYNAAPADPKLPFWDKMEWDGPPAERDAYYQEPYNRNDYVPNPNMVLAHDPRSYSRMPVDPLHVRIARINNYNDIFDEGAPWIPVAPNIYLGTKHYGGLRQGYPRLVEGDYALVSATDMRDLPTTTARYPTNTMAAGIPLYNEAFVPAAAAATMTTANVEIPIDNGWGMYQPLLWTSLFHRLSYFGLYEYMTPGTAVLFGDRDGNPPDNVSVPLPPYTYHATGTFSPAGTPWYKYVLDSDYCMNIGTSDLAVRMGERYIPSRATSKERNARPYRSTVVLPLRPCWPYQDDGSFDQGDFDTYSYQFPFTVFLGTGDADYDVNAEKANMQMGWLMGGGQTYIERGSMTRTDSMSLSTTVWLPFNATDDERATPAAGTILAPGSSAALHKKLDYLSKPEQAPVMKTSIMRYGRMAGSHDLTVTIVTVEDQLTGKKTELSCMPFGTTYRGARQHWRLYSPALTSAPAAAPGHRFAVSANTCIGDFYDVAKGPYAP